MFKRILIANRGEIACRVMRTARRMGIATVAVYSEADEDALHVAMADAAVPIGPPSAVESYLSIEKIIAACRHTGAEAVHPGYGFLSERADFAQALEAAGIVFIGPNAKAIAAMGDKIAAKQAAARAGVPTVPGHLGVIEDDAHAITIADAIGYPVMIKASAGGGGKGMRIAHSRAEVAEGLPRARSEAKSSFGDERVFIEKFIVDPRHVEIQVLGDKHGQVIHLGERECSIQRRNQKVIEESPSPLLDAGTRAAMGAQAVALAKAVGYDSAGTVEFVAAQDKRFYFLEMNTRLQVEHPVTELVTGIDLVEQMIRVAAGERLKLKQADVTFSGWAIETRVCAEDPYRNFLPSIGRLTRYRPPAHGPAKPALGLDPRVEPVRARPATDTGVTVRTDTGVAEGSDISVFYDPLIAKLVTHAPTRAAAIAAQADALDAFTIDGIRHNIAFLAALMQHERWQAGRLSTAFIAEEYPAGFAPVAPAGDTLRVLAAVAAAIDHVLGERKRKISGQRPGQAVVREGTRVVRLGEREVVLAIAREVPEQMPASVSRHPEARAKRAAASRPWPTCAPMIRSRVNPRWKGDGPGRSSFEARLRRAPQDDGEMESLPGAGIIVRFADDQRAHRLASHWRPGDPLWSGTFDDRAIAVQVRPALNGFDLSHRGVEVRALAYTEREAAAARLMPAKSAADSGKALRCPMPGVVCAIAVAEGQEVKAGETLAVIEAMKMENVLRADRDGVVKVIRARPGDSLAVDAVILEFA